MPETLEIRFFYHSDVVRGALAPSLNITQAIFYARAEPTGAPNEKNTKNTLNAVSCFFISFYGLLKGYLWELTLFDLFGCGS